MQNEWQHLFTHDCICGVRITVNVLGNRHSITIGRARPDSNDGTDRFFWLLNEDAKNEVQKGIDIVYEKISQFYKGLETERKKHPVPNKKFEEPKPALGLSALGREDAKKHGDEAVANYDLRHSKKRR
jgi:hypothetical protein